MPRYFPAVAATFVLCFGPINVVTAGYTRLLPPGAYMSTATAVDGNDVVGTYRSGNFDQGYFFNGSTYTTLAIPGYANANIEPFAVSGNNVVGYFYPPSGGAEGFLYNVSSGMYTILDPLSNDDSSATGISGNIVVGQSLNSNRDGYFNWSYNITTGQYTNITPGAPPGDSTTSLGSPHISGMNIAAFVQFTAPNGLTSSGPYISQGGVTTVFPLPGYIPTAVSGDNIVGNSGAGTGFLLNASGVTSLLPPGAASSNAVGVSGNVVVGTYYEHYNSQIQSFIYDGGNYSIISIPDGNSYTTNDIQVTGVSGNNIVGNIPGAFGFFESINSVPEPSTSTSFCLAILSLGIFTAAKRLRL
jgi:hypothetical protein